MVICSIGQGSALRTKESRRAKAEKAVKEKVGQKVGVSFVEAIIIKASALTSEQKEKGKASMLGRTMEVRGLMVERVREEVDG